MDGERESLCGANFIVVLDNDAGSEGQLPIVRIVCLHCRKLLARGILPWYVSTREIAKYAPLGRTNYATKVCLDHIKLSERATLCVLYGVQRPSMKNHVW